MSTANWQDRILARIAKTRFLSFNEACELCTRTCLLIHGERDPSPIVSSFFKVMIDDSFLQVLYIPPRFARLISHLMDQEIELEDSTGQRWKVGISNHNGSLAIRQGWQTFSSEHGLKLGDFLVFHYIQGQHFVVQIYGTSGCQKINFYNGTCMRKERPRTNATTTSHDELSPATDINLREKKNSTPLVTVVPVSDRVGQLPVTTTFASNIDADTLKSTENGVKGKKTRVDKRELKQMAAKTRCPSKKLNGKEPKIIEKDGQGCPEAEIGNNKAIESEPADLGDTSFLDAGNFSCLLRVDGRSFLELPQSWPEVLPSSKKMRKITIYLKGPDNRTRPVIYHEDFGSKVLIGNWASFIEVYGLKPGDECLFQLSNLSERMFTVKATHKVDGTQTTLS
ncbi:B3 domain-containing protein Os01g0905400-like [Solanum verrucosum]|uniref:B3 domain-containing protein Os01g0905400-like n=1 Tax=Solanum verrucosum TaxID=315347 RepID=UPI0020D11A62|nr:B3 domain-containing protein Os01g0905400-like [Solanum verrucosum]